MDDICKIAGRNVRLARDAKDLSQEDLADAAKIDRTYVSGVERGLRNPSIRVMARIAKALGTSPAMLLTKDAKF